MSAEGTSTLIYTSPSGVKQNLAVASDTADAYLETDWLDFADPEAEQDPGPRKKRLRRIRLEVDAGNFQITLAAKNILQEATQYVQTYAADGNAARTFNPMPPMYRWWKIRILDQNPESRWSLTRLQLWGDLGGKLREEGVSLSAAVEASVFTGEVTLVPNQANTVITDARIGPGSKIVMEPKTAHAASAALTVFVGAVETGKITLNHNVSAWTDRTFQYAIFA